MFIFNDKKDITLNDFINIHSHTLKYNKTVIEIKNNVLNNENVIEENSLSYNDFINIINESKNKKIIIKTVYRNNR